MKDSDWPPLTDGDRQAIEAIRQQLDRELGQWLSDGQDRAAERRSVAAPVVIRARRKTDPTLLRVAFGAGAATLVAGTILAFFPWPQIPSSEVGAPTPAAQPLPPLRPDPRARMAVSSPTVGPESVPRVGARNPAPERRRLYSETPAAPRGATAPSRIEVSRARTTIAAAERQPVRAPASRLRQWQAPVTLAHTSSSIQSP